MINFAINDKDDIVVDIDDEGKVKLDIQSSNSPPSRANKASAEPVEEI